MTQSTPFAQVATNLLNVLQGYTKGKRFVAVLTMLLTIGVGSMWGATTTYTFTSEKWVDSSNGWTSGKDGVAYLNSGVQVTEKGTGAYATSKTPFTNISKIDVKYCTNASKGAGTIVLTVGSTSKTLTVSKTGGTTMRTISASFDPNVSGTVKITVNCTTNSIYVGGITITTEDATCTEPTITFSNGSYIVGGPVLDLSNLFDSNSNGAVTYSVTNANGTGATISGSNFTATATGSATVSATQAAAGSYCEGSATATITVSAPAGGGGGDGECTWQLVTDASTLKVGDEIVIAAKDYNYALSTMQNENNRGLAAITKSGNTIETPSNTVQILTLKSGSNSGTWAFYTGSGYLYAASSSSNYLRTQKTNNANGSFSIAVDAEGVASILATGNYTHNKMQYNATSGLFSCYDPNKSQKAIVLYKKVCETPTPILTASSTSLSFGNVTVNSSKQHTFTLSASNLTNNATLALTGTNAGMFSVSPKSVTHNGGTISDQNISVTYSPTTKTSHSATLTISSPGADDVIISLSGTGVAQMANYTVKHYQQNLDGTYPSTPTDTETKSGEVGTIVTPTIKTYTGFGTPSSKSVEITADGNAVVEYQYARNSYTLTWDLDGGTITTAGTTAGQVKYGAPLKAPTVEKTNFQFKSWTPAVPETMPADAATYTAQWTPIYTITWLANGYEHHSQTNVEGTAIDVPADPEAATYACDDKVFVGWIGQEISGSTDEEPTFITEFDNIESDVNYYAVFATPGEGGDDIPLISFLGGVKSELLAIDAISASGLGDDYAESNAPYRVKLDGTGDYILYTNTNGSKITKLYIKVKMIGGENTSKITVQTSDNNSDYTNICNWSIQGTQNAVKDVFLTVDSSSKYIRLYFTKGSNVGLGNLIFYTSSISYSDYVTTCDNTKATITYDLNGGTGATCDETTITKDVEFTLCDQTPTKDGYTFAGWSDGTKTYAAGSQAIVSESTTFYATWTPNTITITWDQNYTDCPESETSTYIYDGEDIEMPENPTRSGYQFDGWYTASIDGTKITEVGTTNKPTDDVTYYAHWAELYTVTFMASGQVYVVQEDKYLSGANLELPADPSPANYACDGYIFDGWSVAEKTIEEATKPELITNPTITKDEIYYAVWKKASSTGAGETIFYESFNQYDSPGGNDDNFNTASSDKDNTVSKSDVTGWSGENVYGAKTCIKLGGGSAKGTVTTPALSQLSGSATLSFKAAAWANNSEQTDLVLFITGGGTLDKTSVTMIKGAWKTYEVTIKDGTSATRITFAGKNTSGSRFFLDEVKVTTSGGYNYTTLPSCGPTIVAKDGMWVTSSNGQSVKVNIPIAVKSFTTTATITGTSTSSNFVVTPLENVSNGINDVVEVIYTPTTANTKESTTITLTAKDGETEVSTTTFTLNGRSLPDQFAIVVDKASEYYALPANMPSEGTYTGFGVEVNAGTITAAPKTHLYTARAVHSTRFTENGKALRLVGNNDACLWASAAKDGTSIRNYANISNATDNQYEWNLYTEDGETYRISCTAVTEEGRILRMYGQKFGMYKSGSDAFHFLPVECTSTPLNVSVSATRTSATISWTNADACNVEVYNGSTKIQTISAASPVVVSNLAESTAYTFTLTPVDNESCVASGAFTTTGPTIDIVEWETNGILIQVDKDNELNPKVVIKGEEEHGNVGGNVADELFFSKYFESHGENKLLAIFNGTTATIDLNGYTIKSENGMLDLSQFGQTKGKVASNEEIILVYYDANYSAEECAEEQQGYENWNILTEKGVLAFSGRGSLGLYKNDVLIDVIGSTFPSGELTKIGKSDQGCGTGDDVRLHIDGKSVNDQSSFFCYDGDNIKTDNVETDYALSTNRCLLIRKNTVTSGANAVATNKATAAATCGDLSSTFKTLGSEWSGFRIGSGSSSSDEIQDATCDGLGYVGGFDYNNYYRTLETLDNSKTLNEYTRNADENTYFIEIEDLAQYSCLNIQLQLTDNEGNVLTEQTSQVPILVAGEKYTTDEIFSAIVKDSETSEPDYETSKIRCATCDVVILENATLTKAGAETVNDVNQVRDIYIYPGGKLVVPANATDYSVNNISLRRVQDEVAAADIQASLNITSSSNAPIFIDVRIDANNWHWFALPYDCNIADVSWADGNKAVYNTDWFLMYYDGESRAASTNPHDNHWKVYEGTKIEAGKGYIVGITGDISNPAVKFELRFPMAQEVLTAEQTDKTVALNAWGVKSDNTPNNKGWNLVGNPYLNYYQPETEGFSGLSLLKYTGIHSVTGDRLYDNSGNVPFLVTPINGGWYEYQQELASDVQMMPFTAYFVQVGDPTTHENGQALEASFKTENRAPKSLQARRNAIEENSDPAIVAVSLTNAKGESDKTTLLIADRFANEYEMNADFFKWFGDYYKYYTKPVLYTIGADQGKRAFNALNEDLATQPISLGMYAAQAGNYTFSLNLRNELAQVQEVWLYDATQDVYTNLLQDDYTFHTAKTESAGRFFLSVKMAPKVTTDTENITSGNIWATTHNKTITINGLLSNSNVWVYDATGKLLHANQTQYFQHSFSVPQTGAYFVRLQNTMQTQTIKVVVE